MSDILGNLEKLNHVLAYLHDGQVMMRFEHGQIVSRNQVYRGGETRFSTDILKDGRLVTLHKAVCAAQAERKALSKRRHLPANLRKIQKRCVNAEQELHRATVSAGSLGGVARLDAAHTELRAAQTALNAAKPAIRAYQKETREMTKNWTSNHAAVTAATRNLIADYKQARAR